MPNLRFYSFNELHESWLDFQFQTTNSPTVYLFRILDSGFFYSPHSGDDHYHVARDSSYSTGEYKDLEEERLDEKSFMVYDKV